MKFVSDPLQHPHFGRTIEVNILGEQKVCNFDCTHCQLGPSEIRISRLKQEAGFSNIDDVLSDVARILGQGFQSGTPASRLETVYVAGNGEPTLHPQFPQFAKALRTRLAELGTHGTRLVCLTNGDLLYDRAIAEAMKFFDETVVRIDGGTQKAFKKINRPITRGNLEKVILGARDLGNLSVLTTVTTGDFSLLNPAPLDEWIEVIAMLKPKKVYLQAAKDVTEDGVLGVSHWLERRLKIKSQVTTGSAA